MIGTMLLALQAAAAPMPTITLADAIRRAASLDPDYVSAVGQRDVAEWGRRAAFFAFILPSAQATGDYTVSTTPGFNFGTNQPASTIVTARLNLRYEVFAGGRKFADYAQSKALVDEAGANLLKARYLSAFRVEGAYYAVLSSGELAAAAQARVDRAGEQLEVSRARVLSGAAVQSDSLQLVLERNRAAVDLLRIESQLRVARLELGRLVGEDGPLDAAPLDPVLPERPPIPLEAAIAQALERGPDYRRVRASERVAEAALRGVRGGYFPTVTLSASTSAFDEKIFPTATTRNQLAVAVSVPIWDNGQVSRAMTQARANRDVARAIRRDLERAARRDVTESYEAYETARRTEALSREAVGVAREAYRVQDARYRGGAAPVVDLLVAQADLAQAEADLVQARYAARLALAGLEVILGRRLTDAPIPEGE